MTLCARTLSRDRMYAMGYPIIMHIAVDIIASQNERTNTDAKPPISEKFDSDRAPSEVVKA